jgi:hypothetical protein
VRFSIDPKARSWLIWKLSLSLCLAAGEAIALALASLFLPLSWTDKGIASIGVLGGGISAILVYGAWGSASCLADIDAWCTAGLAGLGSAALQSIACSVMSSLASADLVGGGLTTCAPNYRRAAAYGGILAMLLGTFAVWVAVRYLTWKAHRRVG